LLVAQGQAFAGSIALFCGKTHPNRKPDRKAAKDLPIRDETRRGEDICFCGSAGRQWPAAEHPKPSSLRKIPCPASLGRLLEI